MVRGRLFAGLYFIIQSILRLLQLPFNYLRREKARVLAATRGVGIKGGSHGPENTSHGARALAKGEKESREEEVKIKRKIKKRMLSPFPEQE